MHATIITPELIEKESIPQLIFPHTDVLISPEEIEQRRKDLEGAAKVGNNSKAKVRILFEDDNGPKMVVTTIWAVTEKMAVLKSNTLIPIHRISKINFY